MTSASFVRVAAASVNQTVGDWTGNENRIRRCLDEARQRQVRLLVLPEMCVVGYSLGDRLLMGGTITRSWQTLNRLLPDTEGIVALVGLPVLHRDVLYNAVAVVADGRFAGIVPKENLAVGDVQYENRWFSGWPHGRLETYVSGDGQSLPIGTMAFEAAGIGRFAVEICEDGWKGIRPGSLYSLAGAHILANPSASWFVIGKHRIRRAMVEQISREDHCVYLYTSLLGCDATRLVFDGSLFIAQDGELLSEGRRFRFSSDHELIDSVVDLASLSRARTEEGSWRQQVETMQRGDYGNSPEIIQVTGDFHSEEAASAGEPYWLVHRERPVDPSLAWLVDQGLTPPLEPQDVPHLELELALALGLREYLKKCGIPGITLALSGGRDSSMCAVLVQRMFRYDNPELSAQALRELIHRRFVTAYMGTDNSGSATRNAARALAEEIGSTHFDGAIQRAVDTHLDIMEEMTGTRLTWDEPAHDIPLQNVQARLRGSLIWMVANIYGYLLISTSNKSEAAVGYATMDGDTSGGLSPIADVPKSLVTIWLQWAASFHGIESLSQVVATEATAELRPPDRNQTDEDDLMPFEVLDQLMFQFVNLGRDPVDVFRTLWPAMERRYGGDRRAFAAHIRKFVRMLCFAQWKRERFAISFRVTAFDLDPKTGFRFPPVQNPFTEELAALDEYIESLK